MKTYTTDQSGRICLGKEFAGKTYAMRANDRGSIELMPVKIVPENDAWLYQNKDAHGAVMEGLEQAKQGKAKPLSFNLDDDVAWLKED